jgi:hypothetical protein
MGQLSISRLAEKRCLHLPVGMGTLWGPLDKPASLLKNAVISQKTTFFIVTAVKASNLT